MNTVLQAAVYDFKRLPSDEHREVNVNLEKSLGNHNNLEKQLLSWKQESTLNHHCLLFTILTGENWT